MFLSEHLYSLDCLLKLKLVTTSPGGGGWTKTELMLFSTQVEVVVELKLELSLAKELFELEHFIGNISIFPRKVSQIQCFLE